MSENIIGFDATTTESGSSKFIRVTPETAIDTGRFLKEIEAGKMENGTAWLQITIVDKGGATANRRYFEPTMGSYITTEADLKKAYMKLNKVVANLVRRFKGEQFTIEKATSYEDFFNKVVAAIKSVANWDKKELRVLVVNGKETSDGGVFPTLPAFPPIFEDASIPAAETKLKITEWHDVRAIDFSNNVVGVTPDEDAADNTTYSF